MLWYKVFFLVFLAFLPGCTVFRTLDFGDCPEKSWEFKFGWEKGIELSKAKPGKTDDQGVYQPETPEAEALLTFPDVHAGSMVLIQPKGRITPTIHLELCEFKIPYLRWFSVQSGAGVQLVDVYVGKKLLSVFEITVGPFVGWDFDIDTWAWGVGGTLIRF